MFILRISPPIKRRLPFVYTNTCQLHCTNTLFRDRERPKEYELRVGYAIATLQDDLPSFFDKGLSDHEIYSQDIVLSDPHYTKLSIHGRTAYFGITKMLKWSTSLYFDHVLLEITKMRVLADDEPNVTLPNDDDKTHFSSIEQTELDIKAKGIVKRLEVRWKMQGIKNATFFAQPSIRHIEGVFIYKFDSQGYIGEHRIQRIVPPPSKRVLFIHSLGVRLRSLFWQRQPILNPGF